MVFLNYSLLLHITIPAHCQPGFLASLVAVFGEYDISGDLETKRSVSKNVKRVIVHRQYDAATFENDLAILELESPVRYDAHIGKAPSKYTLLSFINVVLASNRDVIVIPCTAFRSDDILTLLLTLLLAAINAPIA